MTICKKAFRAVIKRSTTFLLFTGLVMSLGSVASAQNQPTLKQAITIMEARTEQLDQAVLRHLAEGDLSTQKAIKLRDELKETSRAIDSDTSLSQSDALTAARNLDSISKTLTTMTEFEGLPELVVTNDETGKPEIVTDLSGTTAKVESIDSDLFVNKLYNRRTALEKLIASGQATGSLSDSRVQSLRKQLDSVSSLEKEVGRDKQITTDQLAPLAKKYDAIGDKIANLLIDYGLAGMPAGEQFIVTGKKVVKFDITMQRRAGLEDRISRSLAAGKLSESQADSFRQELNKAGEMEAAFREKGNMTEKETRKVESEFDRIGAKLDKAAKSRS